MKKFIIILCVLFMGSTVSAASAKGGPVTDAMARGHNFFIVEHSDKSVAVGHCCHASERVMASGKVTADPLLGFTKKTYLALKLKYKEVIIGIRYLYQNIYSNEMKFAFFPMPEEKTPASITRAGYVVKAAFIIISQFDESIDLDIERALFGPFASAECKETGRLKCAGCNTTKYCSAACQRADWKAGHKEWCKAHPAASHWEASSADTKK